MTCSSCNQELPAGKTGFVVCAHCGAVNISSHADQPIYVHASGVTVSPRHTHHLRVKWIRIQLPKRVTGSVVVASTLCLLVTIGLASAYTYNHSFSKTSVVQTARTTTETTKKTSPPTDKPATTTSPEQGSTTTPTPQSRPTTPSVVSQPTLDQIVDNINQQLSPYGVIATLTPANNAGTYSTWSTLTAGDASNLQQFSLYLTQEFGKYPKDLVINSGLKTIGMVKNLQVVGGGRSAAPAPSITGMLYDVNAMVGAGSEYAREVVSHEYWHYLDYVAHGSYVYADAQWDACNPSGFTYGAGGASAYNDPDYVAAFHPKTAFITTYSTYGREEDRAEMFGWLMYNPPSVKNLGDSGINCKINRLTVLVHQLSPSMTF